MKYSSEYCFNTKLISLCLLFFPPPCNHLGVKEKVWDSKLKQQKEERIGGHVEVPQPPFVTLRAHKAQGHDPQKRSALYIRCWIFWGLRVRPFVDSILWSLEDRASYSQSSVLPTDTADDICLILSQLYQMTWVLFYFALFSFEPIFL